MEGKCHFGITAVIFIFQEELVDLHGKCMMIRNMIMSPVELDFSGCSVNWIWFSEKTALPNSFGQ